VGGSSEERVFVSLEKVRTAHARVRRNFYSDFTAKRFVPRQASKQRQLSTSLENANGQTVRSAHGVFVFACVARFVVHHLNLKLPIRAARRPPSPALMAQP
jgi:hypothetical protein